jgi:hypothetical protein
MVHYEHPDWTAKEVQAKVDTILQGKGPKLSAVQKVLGPIRRDEATDSNPLDTPWSLGSRDNLPPEVLPLVFRAFLQFQRSNKGNQSFTIRMAKWAARLQGFSPDPPKLVGWATFYATIERADEEVGVASFVSTGIDIGMYQTLTGDKISVEERLDIVENQKAELYFGDLPEWLKDSENRKGGTQ